MLEQAILGILGVTAIFLSQDKREKRRALAPIFGLAAQPFWFYTMYMAEQWAVFVLSFFYTYAWWLGFKLHWLRSKSNGNQKS